ncbi:MAG: hypothetical protein HKN92_07780 [Chitinophagales bacterium]|nr:hypothetical protein [Chitinophagales bacterium]
MKFRSTIFTIAAIILSVNVGLSNINITGKSGTSPAKPVATAANKALVGDCPAGSSQFDLDINNVRTRILNGGDLWWDLSDARYEVPKIDPPGSANSVHSLFAGAIWISGVDEGGNLKLAAQTYRQGGDDFWPGPIDDNGNVDQETCDVYDKHFQVFGSEITNAIAAFQANEEQPLSPADVAENVLLWPGKGNPHLLNEEGLEITRPLAPFFDFDDDGIYDPLNGDYPVIGCKDKDADPTFADQMIFWVYNDVGNIHTETGGEAIGIQVNALAFAFQTSDEINDMTFYRYNIVNRSENTLTNSYMGQWVDPDLGCFNDDYVGCDTTRSLGIVYNGDANDEDCQSLGYGSEIPILGIDYFESPTDTNGNEIGMSSFIYYNNDFTGQGNPSTAAQFRNYQTGFWRDGNLVECGGNAYQQGTGPCDYMFPDDPGNAAGWSECAIPNPPADRRFIQNSGPFILDAGAENFITVGALWVRQTNPQPSACEADFDLLRRADDKAQALFDNCFKLVDGPDAPTIKVTELDQQIILTLVNDKASNNFAEKYSEVDPIILINDPSTPDSTYRFQGYKVYQLKDQSVSAGDLDDPTRAQLIFQSDIEDGVSTIINYEFDAFTNSFVADIEVLGNDEGITHSFLVTQNAFATNDPNLVNHRTYYFAAVSYAYNNYKKFDALNPELGGQQVPYIQGRRNFKIYSAIPHIPDARNGGTELNSVFGQGIAIKRVEGQGNGGNSLILSNRTEQKIVASSNGKADTLEYVAGNGPVQVKVVDPFALQEADFELKFLDSVSGTDTITYWRLNDLTNGRTVFAELPIDRENEQIITYSEPGEMEVDYGISISLGQPVPVYVNPENDENVYPLLGSSVVFDDPTTPFLGFLPNQDGQFSPLNWIRSGDVYLEPNPSDPDPLETVWDDFQTLVGGEPVFHDPLELFEDIIGGGLAPYCLAANFQDETSTNQFLRPSYLHAPGFRHINLAIDNEPSVNTLDELQSIVLVVTPDKDKWSKSLVLETGENYRLNKSFIRKGQLREDFSKDKEGNVIGGNPVTTILPGKSYLAVGPTGFQFSYTDNGGIAHIVRDHQNSNPNLRDGFGGFVAVTNIPSGGLPLTLPADVVVYPGEDIATSWFPGYAINLETGERLNVYFGESSSLPGQNGADLIWNPTAEAITQNNEVLFAGKHFVYVMNTPYDEGEFDRLRMIENFNYFTNTSFAIPAETREFYKDILYTGVPFSGDPTIGQESQFLPIEEGLIPQNARFYIQVSKPYEDFTTQSTSTDSKPRYLFSTKGLGPTEQDLETAKSALDLINVVPNPYYAYSSYETNQLDNRVKITNLPNNCTVSIFSINGTLIRKYERAIESDLDIAKGGSVDIANFDNALDWDLKNEKGVPIASGLYLIHVEAPGVGEITVKWFGALRPTDLDSF